MNDYNFATVMKYLGRDGKIHFIVKDKFEISDMLERLDYMEYLKNILEENGEMKKHFYTKELVNF